MSEYNDREGSVASVRHQLHLSPAVVHCVSLDTESKEQQLHPEIRCDDVSIRSCCVIQLRFPIAEECILKAKASEEFKRDVFESDHPWKDWVTFEVYTKEVHPLPNKTPSLPSQPHPYRERHLRKWCVDWLAWDCGLSKKCSLRSSLIWLRRSRASGDRSWNTVSFRSSQAKYPCCSLSGGFGLLPIKKKKLKFVDSMDKELEQGEAFTRDADDPSIDDPE